MGTVYAGVSKSSNSLPGCFCRSFQRSFWYLKFCNLRARQALPSTVSKKSSLIPGPQETSYPLISTKFISHGTRTQPIIKSPPSRENRWARAWCVIKHQRLFFRSLHTKQFLSWCWRSHRWISSLDAHGSLNISLRSTGTQEKYSSGVSAVLKSA